MKPRMTLARITGLVLALAGACEMYFFIYEVKGSWSLRRDKWDCVMGSVEKSNVKQGPDLTIDSRGVVKVLDQGA